MRAAPSLRSALTTRPVMPRRLSAATATAALVAAGVAALALAPAAQAVEPTPSCNATTCSVTFGYTGAEQTFNPPAGVTSVRAVVAGAPGGSAYNSVGGQGGISRGTFALNGARLPLRISVGQAGTANLAATFGGGAPGAAGSYVGGSGGGRSSLGDAAGPLLIAGGGGGGGGTVAAGGAGGGPTGGAGSRPPFGYNAEWVMTDAGGGSQSTGGAGATARRTGEFAYTFPSGAAGDSTGVGKGGAGATGNQAAGGGGGGFHGGGGGADSFMSGGGGSGYISTSVNGTTETGGSSSASVVISWDKTATTTTLDASPVQATPGAAATLTAIVTSAGGTPPGTVAFSDSGTPISGCGAVALSGGVATCQTAFASGSRTLRATYAGTDGYGSSAGDKAYTVISEPAITTTTLSNATFNAAYSQQLLASGGTPPYTFTRIGGSLPNGLTLSATGVISGTPTAAGTFNFTARVTDSSSGTPQSADKPLSIKVGKATQQLAFTFAPSEPQVGGTYTITNLSKGSGSQPLTFAGNSFCSVDGTIVTFTHVGTCTVTANQDGDDNYTAAAPVDHSVDVARASQTITFTSDAPTDARVDGATYTVTATGGASGKPVTFTGNPQCTVVGATVTFTKQGTCVITADQDGDDDYTAAESQTQQVAVGKGAQGVNITSTQPSDAKVNDTYDVTTSGNTKSGSPVVLAAQTPSVCSLNGNTVTFEHVGDCVLVVNQDATDDYEAAPQNGQTIAVGKAEQTVIFSSTKPTPVVGDGYTAVGGGNPKSGNAISYAVTSPNDACTVDEDEVAFTHAGTCTVTATQVGSNDYTAGTAEQVITIGKAPGSVNVTSTTPLPATFGGSYTPVAAPGPGSGTPTLALYGDDNTACSLSGGILSFDRPGTCAFLFTQTGGDDYTDASTAVIGFTVDKASQDLLVTSAPPARGVVGGSHALTVTGGRSAQQLAIAVGAGTTNNACTVETDSQSIADGARTAAATITFARIGTCVVAINQGGDDEHTAAETSLVTIAIDGKPTATTLALSASQVVHGQPVTATATVTGDAAGEVVFFVDGKYYDSQDVDASGTATSRNLAAPLVQGRQIKGVAPSGLPVGNHTVTATFTPEDTNTYALSETALGSSLTVDPAKTTTTVKVNAKTLVATVSVAAPSEDVPTGSVTFLVDGKQVGTAEIVNGIATLDYIAPTGKAVSAVYSGREDSSENTEVNSSSASTARKNPTVTATVTSSKAKTKAGWFSRPATVRFTCTAGSDAVVCPKPVTVAKNGVTTVSRTVMAADGGVATVNVTVKVDQTRPTVKIDGVKAGRIYPGNLPTTRCAATDKVSGIASCKVVRKTKGITVTYTATATDRAGNTTRTSVTVRRTPASITGADYSGPIPVVKLGKGYTLVYTGKGKPSYVNAAPSPVKPKGDGGRFTKIGKNRWAYSVVFTKNLRGHGTWSFGVKVGKKTLVVKVRVTK